MKRLTGIIAILGIVAYLSSCKKTINCDTPAITKVDFFSTISTNPVNDTTVTLVKAKKNSLLLLVAQTYTLPLARADFNRVMYFPDKGVDVYDYDWQMTLHPSGRVFTLMGISHTSTTSNTSDCTNTVTYYLNDSLVTVPGNPYSSVPNFVSDIQIQYH